MYIYKGGGGIIAAVFPLIFIGDILTPSKFIVRRDGKQPLYK